MFTLVGVPAATSNLPDFFEQRGIAKIVKLTSVVIIVIIENLSPPEDRFPQSGENGSMSLHEPLVVLSSADLALPFFFLAGCVENLASRVRCLPARPNLRSPHTPQLNHGERSLEELIWGVGITEHATC